MGVLVREFEKIYQENYKKVYGFLYRMSGDVSIAEDLTQETFLQAFTSFHRFRGECQVFTWLVAIGKNMYFKYLKKNKLQLDSANLEIVISSYYEGSNDPQDIVNKENLEQALKDLIQNIPKKYKEVVMLRIYANLSFAEIGGVLHISENSAKVIYFRAKKQLMEVAKNELGL